MLTQKEVDNFKGKMRCDGNGLYLNKKQSGSMFWVYRYTLNGRYDMYIGEVCKPPRGESDAQAKERRDGGRLTLAEARIERDKWRDFVKQGRDPKAVRDTQIEVERLARARTVAVVAQDWQRTLDEAGYGLPDSDKPKTEIITGLLGHLTRSKPKKCI